MNAQEFLAEFGHIADAPRGMQRLRELILSLAFQGDLCPNSPNSADELLKSIELQREQFNAETRVQRLTRQRQDNQPTRGPYLIPETWRWVTLSTVGHTWGQKKPQDTFVYIDVSSIDNKAGVLSDKAEILDSASAPSRARKIVKKGTVIYSTVRPYLLNIAVVDRDFEHEPIASTAFAVVHPWKGVEGQFLYYYLRSPWFVKYVESIQIGVAYPAISDEKFYSGLIPLPPTEEQCRIVAKVGELMALCDQLEAQQKDRRKLQNVLRQSTLQAIASAQSPQELQNSWQRLQINFGRLFSEPEDVDGMRSLILDLAVRGLLVEPSNSDESVESWLAHVTMLKADLVKKKLISKQTAFVNIAPDDYPFPLPKGWAFVRLGQITNKIGSGSTPRGGREVYLKEGVPFLRSQNVWNDGLDLTDVAFIAHQQHDRMASTAVFPNDILLNITGASLGRCALVPSDFGDANVSQHVTIIRTTDPQVREYLHLCILSPYCQNLIWSRQVGMAREGLSKKVLEQFELPLPPIPEQHRIVARVSELMRLCDEVENQIRSSLRLAERLAISVIASLTGIAIEQLEKAPMKAPQTELIAPLHLGTPPHVKAQAPLATMLARHNGEMSARDLWQRFGGDIDAFYAQLKTEVAHGWIAEPAVAEVRENFTEAAEA